MADLPNEFDIIILGTGLTETVAAAAFSRIGLKVLHLDRNDYYGGSYGNFNLVGLEEWKHKNNDLEEQAPFVTETEIPEDVKRLLQEGERANLLAPERAQAYNIKSQFHVRERTATEEAAARARQNKSRFNFMPSSPPGPESSPDTSTALETKVEENLDKEQCGSAPETETITQQSVPLKEKVPSSGNEGSISAKDESLEHTLASNGKENEPEKVLESQTDTDSRNCPEAPNTSKADPTKQDVSSSVEDTVTNSTEESQLSDRQNEREAEQCINGGQSMEYTVGDIRDEWRRFCFDISPRVLYSCGELVELLIQSDVARYCEFRTVSRILTLLKDSLQQVPCSRADVFSSKAVSLIEKRLMMKFLQFAVDYTKSPEEYQGYQGLPFIDFLKSKKLTANIQHYVQHAIAMATDATPTEDGLRKTQKFLHSLGRFGNTAFLFPLYGTGELPQAFARLSAVFGGIYCLMMSATHLITDSDKCCGIITSGGQKITCRYLIAEASYFPVTYTRILSNRRLSRAIYITDRSILPSEEQELSLMNFVGEQDRSRPVTVMELPPSACVCPKNVFVVHLTRVATCDDAEEDLKEVRRELFAAEDSVDGNKPKLLWSMYFIQDDKSQVELSEKAPRNVLVTSGGGDCSVDLDSCVKEAKVIFHTVCPDEEFLPKPPNPEDIIHVDDTDAAVDGGPSEFESIIEAESAQEENLAHQT